MGKLDPTELDARYRRLYADDETEVSVTGTIETEVKTHRVIKSSNYGIAVNKIYVLAELRVSGGVGTMRVYIDGSNVIELSTTSTSYVLVSGSYTPSWSDDTIHTVSVRLLNSGSDTTYNRTYEMYVSP